MHSMLSCKTIDVLAYPRLGLPTGFPVLPPYKLGLHRLEERLNNNIIITIPFATHRHLQAMLTQYPLIIIRTVLTTPVRMMNTPL